MRLGYLACCLAAAITAGLVHAAAAAPGEKDRARMIMLDECVEGSSRRGDLFSDVADTCRCASRRTIRKLSADQVSAIISAGKITGSAAGIWNAQMKTCKKK